MMNRVFICLVFMVTLTYASGQQKHIVISNPVPEARQEVAEIPWTRIMDAYPALDTSNFRVIAGANKEELEYQLEHRGTRKIQNLLVQVNMPAAGNLVLQIVPGKHKPFVSKTYCRYVPERKDDFAWENDKIAFRMYGKALENSPAEMAYGVDVWVKKTSRLVLNEWYARDEYHADHGDGLDYYHVGLTLGAGGIAPYIHDTIWFSKNYTGWKVLDNGPLRSTFQLSYDEWMAAGRKIKCTKTVSLDAGSQINKVEVHFEAGDNKPIPVVVGVIKRKEPGEMLLDEKDGILAYWEPQHGADGTTGIGCIMATDVLQMMIKQAQLLAETKPGAGQIVYFQGAAWDKAGEISNAGEWFSYLRSFKSRLEHPLKVSIN